MNPRFRALVPYVLILGAAAFLTWNALHFGFTARGDRPGPDVWPRAILALIVISCAVRIVGVLRRRTSSDAEPLEDVLDQRPDRERDAAPPRRYPRLLVTGIALTIAYVALLGTFGFFLDTVLYIALLIRTGRYRRWPVIVAVALSGAFVFMFVFMRVVYLSLPIGSPPFSAVSLALMQLMGIR